MATSGNFGWISQESYLPDGYIADRFETDRGNCYTLHEWIAWKLLDQARSGGLI
ncbi:MAG: hypothetical protein U0Y68_26130 [Blastocatellia bacterium]